MFDLLKQKSVRKGLIAFALLIAFLIVNPFAINDSGKRTHVQSISGKEWVRFESGMYFTGFFSTLTEYPNVVTLMFSDTIPQSEVTYHEPRFEIRFNDATKAEAGATVRWRLPSNEIDMIKIHKEYGSAQKLAESTLSKYTRECLKYSAQLMELITGSLLQ